ESEREQSKSESDSVSEESEQSRSPASGEKRSKQKFRPRDDNETINEIQSNWGAVQAKTPPRKGTPRGKGQPGQPAGAPVQIPGWPPPAGGRPPGGGRPGGWPPAGGQPGWPPAGGQPGWPPAAGGGGQPVCFSLDSSENEPVAEMKRLMIFLLFLLVVPTLTDLKPQYSKKQCLKECGHYKKKYTGQKSDEDVTKMDCSKACDEFIRAVFGKDLPE
ncbi:hypothetical protein COOONC_21638, partial [Cooperia oncophora]